MNQGSVNPQSMASIADVSSKKIRKPYTITKSRENWTEEEHDKFIEALQLFDRDWKKIEDFVGSKTVIQIRSHAQKYFLKVQKNGSVAHVPPPRPKRKASHPYPQKAIKTLPLQGHAPYPPALNNLDPECTPWDGASELIDSASTAALPPQDYPTIQGAEDTTRTRSVNNKNVSSIECSTITQSNSSIRSQGNHGSLRHGIPDFAEVYNFIGSVFDPDTKGHVQRLKEMDPINVETVLLLMRNLSVNLSSPNSEQLRKLLPSHDVTSKNIVCEPEQ